MMKADLIESYVLYNLDKKFKVDIFTNIYSKYRMLVNDETLIKSQGIISRDDNIEMSACWVYRYFIKNREQLVHPCVALISKIDGRRIKGGICNFVACGNNVFACRSLNNETGVRELWKITETGELVFLDNVKIRPRIIPLKKASEYPEISTKPVAQNLILRKVCAPQNNH